MKKRSACVFEPPLEGLAATYAVHLRLIEKHIVNFLLVIIKVFSLGAFVSSQSTRLTDGQTDRVILIGRPRLRSCSAVKTWITWIFTFKSLVLI